MRLLVMLLLAATAAAHSLPSSYNEALFQEKIQSTLSRIRKLLSREKQPLLAQASEVPHEYTDKYLLTELLGNLAISSTALTLETLHLTPDALRTLLSWTTERDVSLKFTLSPSCVYIKEATREVSGDTVVEEEHTGGLFGGTSRTSKRVVHKITEHFWKLSAGMKLQACKGGLSEESCLELFQESALQELVTTSDSRTHSPVGMLHEQVSEVNISPFLRALDPTSLLAAFTINRNATSCITPARNPDIALLATQFNDIRGFSEMVTTGLQSLYSHSSQKTYFSSLFSGNANEIFTPIVPVLVHHEGGDHTEATHEHVQQSRTLSPAHLNSLLREEEASLATTLAKFNGVDSENPRDIISTRGARALLSLHHLADIATSFHSSVMYVERLMRSQLVAAIGKEVTGRDVDDYTHFYAQKLLLPDVAPAPVAYAVRRTAEHSPEGMFSFEQSFPLSPQLSSIPLWALTRKVASNLASGTPSTGSEVFTPPRSSSTMSFPLDASTRIHFSGDQFVHTYLHHSFSPDSSAAAGLDEAKVSFSASARQFSSFVLMLGKLSTSDSFDPQFALVVRSKDELKVALNLAVIPTQKEFRDAIKSLSRNQQAFATAFRSMQLEGSLFAVLIIQIKPQLERVLNLPPQSLQQEIELTEDLMELFIEHQVPSDLLMAAAGSGYGDDLGPTRGNVTESAGVATGIDRVRENVRKIQGMIARAREKDLREKKQHDAYNNVRPASSGAGFTAEFEEDVSYAAALEGRSRPLRGHHKKSTSMRAGAGGVPQSVMMKSSMAIPQAGPEMMMADEMDGGGIDFVTASDSSSQTPSPADHKDTADANVHTNTNTKSAMSASSGGYPFTMIPQRLQDAFEQLGGSNTLRPTIVTVDEHSWTLQSQKNVFSPRTTSTLDVPAQRRAKKQALDLLDALTRSGGLAVTHSSLHVLVAATHVFDRSVMETLVQGDVNPLERLEQSLLVMLQTLHEQPAGDLVTPSVKADLARQFPVLFPPAAMASSPGAASVAATTTGSGTGTGAGASTGAGMSVSASTGGGAGPISLEGDKAGSSGKEYVGLA